MATIINNPRPTEHTTTIEPDSTGWAVAIVILILIVAVGLYYWFGYRQAPINQPDTIINVTTPAPTTDLPPAEATVQLP